VGDFTVRLVLAGDKSVEFYGPGDITKEITEAIVNAANSSLLGGGGVDGAIHRAGGPSILEECRRIVAEIGRLPAGRAVITTGGRLPSKYVIHTVGPIYRGGKGEAETLAACYRECIRVAEDHVIHSIAFPSVSTGAYGYPVEEAAAIAVSSTLEALTAASHVRNARFVLFDRSTLRAYADAARSLHANNPSKYKLEESA
jgi:O-acetyl-ADP-ribose deacetylase (regulator of RNase III)